LLHLLKVWRFSRRAAAENAEKRGIPLPESRYVKPESIPDACLHFFANDEIFPVCTAQRRAGKVYSQTVSKRLSHQYYFLVVIITLQGITKIKTLSIPSQVTPETIPQPNLCQAVSDALQHFIKSYAALGETYTPERDGLVVLVESGDTPEDHKNSSGRSCTMSFGKE
jgi:hypothetical protein